MCGLAGIYNYINLESARRSVDDMVGSLHHRGPDESGFYSDDKVVFGHARLSIVDIDSGAQPIFNEDKSIVVIFNGEIFNYKELRSSLVQKGHRFYTYGDTEVIVHLYEEYGVRFPEHLNGQFSIALWNKKTEDLYLCRDRYGITPLFFSQQGRELVFGSEIKSILKALSTRPTINQEALNQIFTFWTALPPYTFFKDVYQLPPGTIVQYRNGRLINEKKYWDFSFPESGFDRLDNDLFDEITSSFQSAIDIRLRADVPVGSYLSGGIDSSILAYQASQSINSSLSTFSLNFSQQEFDEKKFQDDFSSQSNIKRSSIIVSNEDIRNNFLKSIYHIESPILRSAPIPMGLLSGHVRKSNYKVVLTGEGADEVFGGYDLFKETKIRHFWAANPSSTIRPQLFNKMYPYLLQNGNKAFEYLKKFYSVGLSDKEASFFSHMPRWKTTEKAKTFFTEEFSNSIEDDPLDALSQLLPDQFQKWHYINKAQYLEVITLMSGYLLSSQGDRVQMMNSVEGRFPFLDHNLATIVNKVDPRDKIKGLNEKYILKNMARGKIANSIVNRQKQPYRAPDAMCFQPGLNQEIDYLSSFELINKFGIFDADKIQLLLNKLSSGRLVSVADNQAFMGVLSTQAMCYLYLN